MLESPRNTGFEHGPVKTLVAMVTVTLSSEDVFVYRRRVSGSVTCGRGYSLKGVLRNHLLICRDRCYSSTINNYWIIKWFEYHNFNINHQR